MKKLITIIIFSVLIDICVGQNTDSASASHVVPMQEYFPRNAIFVELLGNSMYYSLNYERMFFPANRVSLSLRSGLCYVPQKKFGTAGIPVLINGILRITKNIYFELGAGLLILAYNTVDQQVSPENPDYVVKGAETELTGAAGLRIRGNKGFLFRLNFTPIFMTYHKDFVPWGGLSFGYCF